MERLQAFEAMLEDIVKKADEEQKIMEDLRRQRKEKTATYRQYLGNRLMYTQVLAMYKKYGLL
ncbi:MAG: hypothetical protein IIZ10_07620 [Solobacterium sp.]|nr:hypothetical protein [Solobacterium sp.]MBQ8068865.1 hypothetical protein [Solobacterium sp.]